MSRAARKPKTQPQLPTETIRAKIARVRFHNPTNGYSVIVLAYNDEVITAVGNMTNIREGDEFELAGSWITDPKWGKQFKFSKYDLVLPTSKPGIVAYLASTAYGIGNVRASQIYDTLGQNCLEIIQEEGPSALVKVPGIKPEQAEEIYQKLTANQTLAELTAMICREGVTANLAHRIYNQFGQDSIKVVKENPYVLADELWGVGFKIADRVAQSTGILPNSPYRVEAAVDYVLKEAGTDGHVYLRPRNIVPGVLKLVGEGSGVDVGDIAMANSKLIEREKCIREGDCIYPVRMYEAEVNLAARMRALCNSPRRHIVGSNSIRELEQVNNVKYAPEQEEAVKLAIHQPLSIITGGPGTGKSTITNAVVSIYKKLEPKKPIYLAAPTGRAAKRISETTGMEAKTIHRLLKYNPHEGGFQHNEGNPLEPGLLIVDEYSMADVELSNSLFRAIPNQMQVVLVGDVDQLPSVGPGSVLRDSIASGVIPTVRLEYNYRQAAGSNIAHIAHMVNAGIVPPLYERAEDYQCQLVQDADQAAILVVDEVKKALAEGYGIMDFQVLAPMRRGQAGVNNLNELIREIVNPARPDRREIKYGKESYREGDKVMVIKNDYEKGVFNGDIGYMVSVGQSYTRSGDLVDGAYFNFEGDEVFFPREEFDKITLAYAGTVHKCVSLDTLVETDRGLMRINDASSGRVAAIDGAKEFVRTPVLPEKEMLCITTEDGYRVTVTPDHGLDTWDGQKYCRVEAQELKAGDWLQVGLGARVEPLEAPKMPVPTNGDIREKIYRVPFELTAELAEFIGLMVADGTCFERGFRLGKRHEEVTDHFAALCTLCRWLMAIGGMAPNKKAVPSCILSGSSEHHRAFLRGLFEDAAVNLRSRNANMVDHIDFTTCQEQLAADVQVMLARLGIVSNHVRNANAHGHSKIYIYGEYARVFGETIGFITHEKQRRSLLAAGQQTRYLMPVSKDEAASLYNVNTSCLTKSDKGNLRVRGHISRNKCASLENMPKWLKSRCANHHTRIASIEKVIGKSTCLHVPDGNRFLQNAISGWNSQGSEFPLVIMPMLKQHYIMLQRNLLYTGITRAKKKLVLVCQEEAINQAVKNDRIAERYSLLSQRLQGGI